MDFGQYVRKKRKDKGLSLREAAKRSHMSHPYLSQLENSVNKKPSPDIIRKISTGLNISYVELLEAAGYLTEENNLTKKFGDYIKELRQKSGKTLQQVSEKSGLSVEYLANAEDNKELEPSKNELQKLGEALGIHDLYTWFLENTSYLPYGGADILETIENNNAKAQSYELESLLKPDTNLYFKGTRLSEENKEKIREMLKIIL